MFWKKMKMLGVFLLSFVLLLACEKEPNAPIADKGGIVIYLTDSPGDYEAVNIVVNRVEVHRTEVGGSSDGWIVINDKPQTYDLLQLRNGATTVLGEEELSPGHYSQIRLIIDPGSHVVVNGTNHDLYIPSGNESGFKFTHAFTIEENKVYELTLDFDVKQSIFITGADRYTLQPTLRLIPNVISGTISGTILPTSAEAYVWTMSNTDSVFAYPDNNGFFKLMALPEGNYDINVFPENIAYKDTLIQNVAVVREENTDKGTINLIEK